MDIINHFLFGKIVELLRYFDQFHFNTLRVFNIFYASLLTVLYEPSTFFTHNQSLRAVNSL